jgi:hypothetical protein
VFAFRASDSDRAAASRADAASPQTAAACAMLLHSAAADPFSPSLDAASDAYSLAISFARSRRPSAIAIPASVDSI